MFYFAVLLTPWWIKLISRISWKDWLKRCVIVIMVLSYTIFAGAGIVNPDPQLPTKIFTSVWLVFTLILTLISAYYAWPRPNM
jgi:hypothetical protein